ncbi:DNA sulfur modification protein DndB [Siminovitchia sp. 179-K 8D1 HS]|uniref:DNA sulfur modification protein DndB n=1 Tax=Siminovitchia sp. 179-K 8D1 HS TaxID=3142385 RepID=UPI0039A3A09D
MKVSRAEVIEILKNNLDIVRKDSKIKKEIKDHMAKYGVVSGIINSYLINPDRINDIDIREIGLLIEQLYLKTGDQSLNPEKFFTKSEITEMRQYHFVPEDDSVHLPIELENFSVVGNGVYVGVISANLVARLMKSHSLYYNFDIQRQATRQKRMDEVILKPTIYKKNVREIKDMILKGELVSTTLAFNAAIGTADEGEELTYNSSNQTLTINEGTRLDILDGMHRCLGSLEAYEVDKNIKTNFILKISNYTTKQAQQYQAQLAKATPIPKTRVQELEANRLADTVVQSLRSESELRGKISSTHTVSVSTGEMVSYNTLADTIDDNFKMESRLNAISVGKYLSEFFDYLFDYFARNKNKYSEDDLLTYNKMFAGYIILAKRMQDEEINLTDLDNIMDSIDFSRTNPLWEKLGVVENGIVTTKSEKGIKKYFKKIKLKK